MNPALLSLKETLVATKPKIRKDIPWSRIRSALRREWFWHWQRREAIKRANGKCEACGKSLDKAYVHHIEGIMPIECTTQYVKNLFCSPDKLKVLHKKCHDKEHKKNG